MAGARRVQKRLSDPLRTPGFWTGYKAKDEPDLLISSAGIAGHRSHIFPPLFIYFFSACWIKGFMNASQSSYMVLMAQSLTKAHSSHINLPMDLVWILFSADRERRGFGVIPVNVWQLIPVPTSTQRKHREELQKSSEVPDLCCPLPHNLPQGKKYWETELEGWVGVQKNGFI